MNIYDAAKVKADYERRHPGCRVVGTYEHRKTALNLVAKNPGRKVDLSYGYYIVIEEDK